MTSLVHYDVLYQNRNIYISKFYSILISKFVPCSIKVTIIVSNLEIISLRKEGFPSEMMSKWINVLI